MTKALTEKHKPAGEDTPQPHAAPENAPKSHHHHHDDDDDSCTSPRPCC